MPRNYVLRIRGPADGVYTLSADPGAYALTGADVELTYNEGAGAAVTLLHGVSGPVSSTSHRVKFKVDADATGVRLAYSTDSDMETGLQYTATQDLDTDNGHTFDATLTGLDPDTEYFWAAESGGNLSQFQGQYGRFRTAPVGPKSFSFAFGNCNQYSGGEPRDLSVWDHIRTEEPAFFCHLDDFHYGDISGAGLLAERIAADEEQLGMPKQGAAYMRVPLIRNVGDHDFGGNDSFGGSPTGDAEPGKADVLAAYKQTMPHPTLEDPDGGVYWAFTWGRVRFLKTDGRFYRDSRWQTGGGKTLLGTAQKAWFKSEIDDAATDLAAGAIALVVVLGDVPWTGDSGDDDADHWEGYAAERAELAEYIEQAGMTGNLYWLCGDMHRMGYDDGSNTRFSTTNSGLDAFPTACGGSLGNQQGLTKGAWTNVQGSAGENNVGFLSISDAGGDSVTVTTSLRAVDSGLTTYTEPLGSFEDVFSCTAAATAELAFDFDGGSDGVSVAEMTSPIAMTYTDALAGPFGEDTVAECFIAAGDNDFGGLIASDPFTLDDGEDLWIRSYHYFPSGFCSGYGSLGDGWGNTKWMRVEWDNGSAFRRLTGQLGSFGNQSCNASGPSHRGATTESFPDGTHNLWWGTNLTIPRDQWVAIQWHIHAGDASNGYLRGWVGETYLGEVSGNATHPGGAFSQIGALVYGDYWNGNSHQNNTWYVSDFIFMKQQPSTTDSGGRPYISPATRVSDV